MHCEAPPETNFCIKGVARTKLSGVISEGFIFKGPRRLDIEVCGSPWSQDCKIAM
jgi:hypothetical protein